MLYNTSIFVRRWLRQALLLLLLALCGWFASPVLAQTVLPQERLLQNTEPLPCGTPDIPIEKLKIFAKYIKQAETRQKQSRTAATGITYLGIKPWLVSGSIRYTTSSIVGLVNRLNQDFGKTKIQFFIVTSGVGSFTAISPQTLIYPDDERNLMATNFDATAINVYFADRFLVCPFGLSVDCNEFYGSFPNLDQLVRGSDRVTDITNPNVQAKNNNYIMIGNGLPSTLTHEMGHYFGLLHTHQGSDAANCQDRERPGSGDTDRGDLIADTDADPYPLYTTTLPFNTTTCVYSGTLRHCATNQPFNPPVANTMSYWRDEACGPLFSTRQKERMTLFLAPRLDPANQYQPQNGVEGITVGPTVSLSLNGTNRRITVSALPGAMGYILETDFNASFPDPLVLGTTSLTATVNFSDNDVPPPGTTYYYRVRATNSKTYSRVLSYPCTAPTAIFSGSQTVSNGQSATYTVALTGTPPWTVQVGGTTYSNVTASPLTIVSPPFQALPGTFTQTTFGGSVTNACGTAPMSGTASVTVLGICPTLSVNSSLTQIGCGRTTGQASISVSGGQPPYTIFDFGIGIITNGTTVTGLVANAYILRIFDARGNIDGCAWTPYVFLISDIGNGSTARLAESSDNRKLRGQQTSIRVQLTGTAPWSVTYAGFNNQQQVASSITTSSYDIEVLPQQTTTYRLVAVSGQCSPTAVSGSRTLIVVPALSSLEYFVGNDPGVGQATSVAVGSNRIDVNPTIAVPISAITRMGVQVLGVRAKDADGYWSPTTIQTFVVLGTGNGSAISQAEYYVNDDPGIGQGVALPGSPTPGVPYNLSINTGSLTPGTHTLVIRTKDAGNRWSISYMRPFMVNLDTRGISRIEYFFDNNDPGLGSGQPFSLDSPNSATATGQALAGTSSLSVGAHSLKVRAQAGGGQAWSTTRAASFTVTPCDAALATLNGSSTITTNQIASISVLIGGSPPFSLTANGQLVGNFATSAASFTLALTVPGTYTLTPQSVNLAVANSCGAGQVGGSAVVTVLQGTACNTMQTVKAGAWNDPTVWSCGRLPVVTDAVLIRHAVTVPAGFVSHAQKVGFEVSGKLSWGTASRLRLGL